MSNTLSCPFPANLDYMTVNGFNLSISKLPDMTFFCQEANIPAVTHHALRVPTPLSIMQQPSSMLEYAPLEVAFMVDSQMANYFAVYNWMRQIGFPEDWSEFRELMARPDNANISADSQVFSTGFIQVLGPNNLAVKTVKYVDLFPTSLSTAIFSSALNDVKYLVGRAAFMYSYYIVE